MWRKRLISWTRIPAGGLISLVSSTQCDGSSEDVLLNELTQLYEQKQLLQQNRQRIDEQLMQVKRRQQQIESTLRELRSKSHRGSPVLKPMQTGEAVRLGQDVYTLQGQIGRGSFGIVRKALNQKTKAHIALKRSAISDSQAVQELQHELEILQAVQALGCHKHIVQVVGSSKDDHFLTLGIEFMDGGDLFSKLCTNGALQEADAMKIAYQILEALEFLHRNSIVHGDLKPENILLDQSQTEIKLADFGCATMKGISRQPHNDARTTAYCPPEILLGSTFRESADMWALGCIIFVLLCGTHPFDPSGRSTKGQIEAKIVTQDVTTVLRRCRHVSPTARDLITKLLCREETKRLTAEKALEHAWFRS